MRMPGLRFKADDGSEFPDWEERTSVELCSRMIGGGTPSTSNTDNYNGDISWISSSDLDVDNITKVRRTRFITERAITTSATKKAKPGSIAVVLRVGVGKVALLDRETCTSQDFISLEDVTGDTKFIAYMLSARMQREAVRTQGTSIKGIPATRFKELTYRMPSSIIEQRKIADLLSTVDDVITAQQAEVDAWEQRKKGVMQKLFSQEVRFKADDGFDYPDWESKSFSDVFMGLSNNTLSRDCLNSKRGQAKNIHYGDVLIKYGSVVDIQNDGVPFVNSDIDCKRWDCLHDGDIVIADTAEDDTVGKVVEIMNVGSDTLFSGLHTIACRPRDAFASKYLGYYMNSKAYHDQLRPYMQGIKVTSVSKSNISSTHIEIPSLPEQRKIADCLSSINDVVVKAKAELAKWRELKKGLLQQMFV